jgi:hypothetical protein
MVVGVVVVKVMVVGVVVVMVMVVGVVVVKVMVVGVVVVKVMVVGVVVVMVMALKKRCAASPKPQLDELMKENRCTRCNDGKQHFNW